MRDSERLDTLIKLISERDFHDQKELQSAMSQRGYLVTQSSISRDLKALKATKQRVPGGRSKYVILEQEKQYIRIRKEQTTAADRHWYVQYTRMFHEKKVAEYLTAKGIECWLPTQKVKKKWSDRVKIADVLVITKTVFVHCTDAQRKKDTFAPASLAYMIDRTSHEPAIIPDNQMETFQRLLAQSDVPVEFTEDLLQPGTEVEVMAGAFAGMNAELLQIKNKDRVIIRIDCLGTAVLEIPLEHLKAKQK